VINDRVSELESLSSEATSFAKRIAVMLDRLESSSVAELTQVKEQAPVYIRTIENVLTDCGLDLGKMTMLFGENPKVQLKKRSTT